MKIAASFPGQTYSTENFFTMTIFTKELDWSDNGSDELLNSTYQPGDEIRLMKTITMPYGTLYAKLKAGEKPFNAHVLRVVTPTLTPFWLYKPTPL